MIDKTIHYVWLSGDEKPALVKKCINSWKEKLPDYEIREWTARDFRFDTMPAFVQEAYQARKWAFVTDYLRLYIVEQYGGIYMDSDIFVRRSIDPFLAQDFFSFVEFHAEGFAPYAKRIDEDGLPLTDGHIPGFCMQAAMFGAEKHHPFLRKCMQYYEQIHFVRPDEEGASGMIAPDIYALVAREFGFRYQDREQQLQENMVIYPSSYVAGCFHETDPKKNYAIHCCMGSWRKSGGIRQAALRFLQKYYYPYRYMR